MKEYGLGFLGLLIIVPLWIACFLLAAAGLVWTVGRDVVRFQRRVTH